MLVSDLGSPLCQFCLESSPRALVLVIVFVLEQPECLFCAQLSDTGEVLDAEAIQHLGFA